MNRYKQKCITRRTLTIKAFLQLSKEKIKNKKYEKKSKENGNNPAKDRDTKISLNNLYV